MIEVWRPGRPPGERRPRDGDRRGRRRPRGQDAAKPAEQPAGEGIVAAASTEPTAGATTETSQQAAPDGEGRERRGRPRHRRRDGEQREGGEGRAEVGRQDRHEKRDRSQRPDRPERQGRPPRRDRDRDRRDDNRPSRTWSSDQQQRGKEPDPNSPFAKLMALKEQLEANKERR
jgi:ATP-dependent RNA helicase SUPV3L1/SUV3